MQRLVDALRTYSSARKKFLNQLNEPGSNRDPLSEFAEEIVACLYRGERAPSRTQRGWDVTSADGLKIRRCLLA